MAAGAFDTPLGVTEWHAQSGRPRGSGLATRTRFLHAVVGVAYLTFYWLIYRVYISVVWGYAGFLYRPLSAFETIFVVVSVAIVSAATPVKIDRPSSMIYWLMYSFVYVPTMAMTLMIGRRPVEEYILSLSALGLAMVAIAVVIQLPRRQQTPEGGMPSSGFALFMAGGMVVLTIIQLYLYSGAMSFASVDEVYDQRLEISTVDVGYFGYLRTHYYYLISPALMALGLCVRRWRALIVFALAGFVMTYMIEAAKIALLVPIAMVALYLILTRTSASVVLFTGGLTALTFVCSLLAGAVSLVGFLADLLIMRSISVPGQTFHQYQDLFTERGYTYWSSVSGINLLVPPPAGFMRDPQWPQLGVIIGREFYGSTLMNANANPFSGEGVAAAGPVGVIVIGLVVALYLRIFDAAAVGWNKTFGVLIAAPLGLALTNVHLSTLLLSFGGATWLLILHFYKPQASIHSEGRGAPGATR